MAAGLLALAGVFFGPASAAPGDELQVSLLTFSPGEIYWQRFGHNAILVRNAAAGSAVVYNYGMFDFKQERFFLNFARGRMQYHLSADSLEDTLWQYDREGRGIVEQQLAMTPGQRLELDQFLRWNALPENAPYAYDYFLANCSTKLRDALDDAIDNALKLVLEATPTPATFRSEAVRLISPDLVWMLGMDFGMGPAVDRPINLWERSFVPAALMEGVRTVRVIVDGVDQPLVLAERELLPRRVPDAPARRPDLALPMLAIGLGLGIALLASGLARASAAARLAFAGLGATSILIFGLAGLISLAIWTLTDHWSGARSPNLLHYSPLLLLLVPGFARGRRPDWRPSLFQLLLIATLCGVSVVALAVSFTGYGAAGRHWVGLALPVLAALAFVTWRARRRA